MTARRPRITSRDIAREAGVSQPTVSRALRGDPRVSAATVALVEHTARRLGYVPDAAGRSLSTRRTGTVAIVIADITNPFYPELVEALHAELGRAALRAVLLNERTDPAGAAGIAALLRSGVVDGAIVATATLDATTRALLTEERAPIVQLVREVDGVPRDAVVADNHGGAALAAGLLAGLGHRRIAGRGRTARHVDGARARPRLRRRARSGRPRARPRAPPRRRVRAPHRLRRVPRAARRSPIRRRPSSAATT